MMHNFSKLRFFFKNKFFKKFYLSKMISDYNNNNIVLIYSIGKTGTSTIYRSLKLYYPFTVLKTQHFLDNDQHFLFPEFLKELKKIIKKILKLFLWLEIQSREIFLLFLRLWS